MKGKLSKVKAIGSKSERSPSSGTNWPGLLTRLIATNANKPNPISGAQVVRQLLGGNHFLFTFYENLRQDNKGEDRNQQELSPKGHDYEVDEELSEDRDRQSALRGPNEEIIFLSDPHRPKQKNKPRR